MNAALGFGPAVFGRGAGIFFVAYALCEVPSNLIIARLGARRWIALIMIVWGVIASAMFLVRTPLEFYGMRLLLGVAEAGFFPGIIYYLGTWFPSRHRAAAFAVFGMAIPLSQTIGGPLSAALLKLDGLAHLAGWQWLFLVEGFPSVLLGLLVLRTLVDRPSEARWLSREQRDSLGRALAADPVAAGGHASPLTALAHPLVWLLAVPWFAIYALGLSYSFWAPLLIRDALGTGNSATALIAGGLALSVALLSPAVGRLSDRLDEPCLLTAAGLAVAGLGCVGMAVFPQSLLRIGALYLIALNFLALAGFWCLPTRLLRGESAAPAIALINAIGACGGYFGPTIIGSLKEATGSDAGAFIGLGAIAAVGVIVCLGLRRMPVFKPRRVGLA
jgi:ACS family tartrate transporter-like MFS transporter